MRRSSVLAFLALGACGGGSSTPNPQSENLAFIVDGETPEHRLGVDNGTEFPITDLLFRKDTFPVFVDAFLGEGGFIPPGMGWQSPDEVPDGFYYIVAETDIGTFSVTFFYEAGVSDAWKVE